MSFLNQKKVQDLIQEKAKLITQLNELAEENESLKAQLKLAEKEQLDQIAGCQFEIDFDALKAFSVERKLASGVELTCIGYLNNEGRIKEWQFICSRETHNRLAKEFVLYKTKSVTCHL